MDPGGGGGMGGGATTGLPNADGSYNYSSNCFGLNLNYKVSESSTVTIGCYWAGQSNL